MVLCAAAGAAGAPDRAEAAEQDAVRAHFGHLQELLRRGCLVLAGPSVAGADTFGIVILECEEGVAREAMEETRRSCAAS